MVVPQKADGDEKVWIVSGQRGSTALLDDGLVALKSLSPMGAGRLALLLSLAFHGALVAIPIRGSRTPSKNDLVEVEVLTSLEATDDDEKAAVEAPTDRATVVPIREKQTTSATPNRTIPVPSLAPPNTLTAPPAAEELPRFTIAISAMPSDRIGDGAPSTAVSTEPDTAPMSEQSVDEPARLVRGLAPTYPAEARVQGVEGDVVLELIVNTVGNVESARVVRSMGHGLDEAALAAAQRFAFAPAKKWGRSVRVRMNWAIEFRLQ
jgi:protein TonB